MKRRKVWERAAAVAVVLVSMCMFSMVEGKTEQVLHSETYTSLPFELGSGDVKNVYQLIDWPAGHIALRSYHVELVDENDISVPLYNVYMHHWTLYRYKRKKGHKELHGHSKRMASQEEAEALQKQDTAGTDGPTSKFGCGAEFRNTINSVPAPYGIISGDPGAVPEGYEEAWYLNVHGINTVGILDKASCYECRCKAYNLTADENGRPLSEGYDGGLLCCYDNSHCNLPTNANSVKRKYFLKYTITYVEWDSSVIPLKMYDFYMSNRRSSPMVDPPTKHEYSVEQCNKESNKECIDRRDRMGVVTGGGDIIHVVMHQHVGGLGGVVRNKDGGVICQSDPIYGTGNEAGNEAGYLVGMTSCNLEPGTVILEAMEELHFEAYYSGAVAHSGVMSEFILFVADPVTYIAEVTE